MYKDNEPLPQEVRNSVKETVNTKTAETIEKNLIDDEIDLSQDVFILGGGDPNLSPDAGKPLI